MKVKLKRILVDLFTELIFDKRIRLFEKIADATEDLFFGIVVVAMTLAAGIGIGRALPFGDWRPYWLDIVIWCVKFSVGIAVLRYMQTKFRAMI